MTDEMLLSQQTLENAYTALKADDVANLCKQQTGAILASLLELARTTTDAKLRRKADALLADVVGRLRVLA